MFTSKHDSPHSYQVTEDHQESSVKGKRSSFFDQMFQRKPKTQVKNYVEVYKETPNAVAVSFEPSGTSDRWLSSVFHLNSMPKRPKNSNVVKMAKEVREETIWKKNGSATVQKTMKTIRTAKYVETTEVSNHQ